MLGKYQYKRYVTGGQAQPDSQIAINGGISISQLGSQLSGYTRLDDPFFPFATVEIDFDYSPLFGNIAKLSKLDPKNYASYLKNDLVTKYAKITSNSDDNNGIILEPSRYNPDANYMVEFTPDTMISAAEWLYMKICGVPEVDKYENNLSDLNEVPLESSTSTYDSQIESLTEDIKKTLELIQNETSPLMAEIYRERLSVLEADRQNVIATRQAADASRITANNPITSTSGTSTETTNLTKSTLIPSARVRDFIRSCTMFYEMIQNHAYMISSIDLGDIIEEYYKNENCNQNANFSMKLSETVDMKATRMMYGFFQGMYDAGYQRQYIPSNLCEFNMTIYIHDVRSFINNNNASGYLLKALKNANIDSNLNTLAAEHTSCMAICLLGCKFESYASNYNSLSLTSPQIGPSADVIDIKMTAGGSSISMVDMHDLTYNT